MGKRDMLTKGLAIAGTILAWLPILAPIGFSMIRFLANRMFRFDYLTPAEFFPIALLGGGLLLWASLRARSRLRIIGWGLGVAAGALIGGQALAVVTGLASGETGPNGWQRIFVLASIVIYTLALVVIGLGGALLVRDLFTSSASLHTQNQVH